MNPFEFVLIIILITTVGGIMKARYGVTDGSGKRIRRRDRGRMSFLDDRSHDEEVSDSVETARLKDEVRSLKDRIATLERITVDKESSLSREIDSLRDR